MLQKDTPGKVRAVNGIGAGVKFLPLFFRHQSVESLAGPVPNHRLKFHDVSRRWSSGVHLVKQPRDGKCGIVVHEAAPKPTVSNDLQRRLRIRA